MPRLLLCLPLLLSSLALAAPAQNGAVPLLPQSFAGWSVTGSPPPSHDAENFAVLKEDGISRSEAATYSSGANRLTVETWQFTDATGAYSAFTFYLQPPMHPEDIGSGAASAGDHFVFWTGVTVVDASFAHPAKDEPATLAALAADLPKVGGGAGVPPSLPHYLPQAGLNPASVKYAIGPASYAAMGGTLPASAVDFSQDAEAITAQYGPAQSTLTLVMYPTPQMAEAHLKTLQTSAQNGASLGALAKRSGPLLAVVRGSAGPESEKKLLGAIRFNDTVTINHPEGYVPETVKLYRLLTGITILTVILIGSALLLGIFLGGGRALLRVLRGKPVSSVSEEEFISLHLGG
ncbi:MAG TPA: DUF6599 family protein [Acidobacteriaceae bacterium]